MKKLLAKISLFLCGVGTIIGLSGGNASAATLKTDTGLSSVTEKTQLVLTPSSNYAQAMEIQDHYSHSSHASHASHSSHYSSRY